MNVSIIIPVLNEENNLLDLVERIRYALIDISYEIIFIDDHSTDNTKQILQTLAMSYPLTYYEKQGKNGKAYSLLEGFSHARYENICILDGDLQYPPEAIPHMLAQIDTGAGVVVASRNSEHAPISREIMSRVHRLVFGKLLHGFDCDIQSGLKVFRKEIIDRVSLNPSPWTFDLELLIKARDAGYPIVEQDIIFARRQNGKTKVNLFKTPLEIGWSSLKLKLIGSQVIPFSQVVVAEKGYGFHYKGKEFIPYSPLPIEETAFFRVDTTQKIIFSELLIIFGLCLFINWHLTILLFLAGLTLFYFVDVFFTLYPIIHSYTHAAEVQINQKDLEAERDWPTYTIMCPLYKEWAVIPQFVQAMTSLEYPKDKLQVILLLEADDTESIKHISDFELPSYFQVVVVPDHKPKTKPCACNYGLKFTTGDYTVVYDAEDIPDIYQLKKAILAFERSPDTIACVQAKLNFYNPGQNLLTRAFSAEYSLWFDLILPGLQSIHAPIPLGGTSNIFPTALLRKLGGWDAFNLTEDCDLGTRLFKKGYQTIIIDSLTLEEANTRLGNWFGQRSRWIQGYIQTYLVHMREPGEFLTNQYKQHIITYQFIILGKTASFFINFFLWGTTITYFLFRPQLGKFIESFYPAPILYLGVFCLIVGNFLYMYYYMIACMKHGHYPLLKYILFVPVYWLCISLVAWRALYGFLTRPHFWYKTQHGLLNQKGKEQMQEAIQLTGVDLAPTIS